MHNIDTKFSSGLLEEAPASFTEREIIPAPEDMTLGDEQLVDAEIESVPQPIAHLPPSFSRQLLFGGTLVLIAFNLRPLFSSLSAVLPSVTQATGLSPAGVSLLTTLPVLCLGIFAPLAPVLARRFGAEVTILALMVLLGCGTALRALGTIPALAIGTIASGMAIAIVNVLLPGLIKRDFAHRTGLMSGLYTMALCAGAAAAAGLTVPLQRQLDGSWTAALFVWSVPALFTALLWAPQITRQRTRAGHALSAVPGLWTCPLAWKVTAFMALQSMFSFSVFGWLAPILQERGLPAAAAGSVVSASVLCQTAACLVAPGLAARSADQRLISVCAVLMAAGGFIGCLFAPMGTIWGWAMLQGFGQGALTSVALTLIVLRSRDAHVAAQLSGMVQGVGYGLGATGPLLVGLLHGWTGSFHSAGIFFSITGALCIAAGLGAGRALYVSCRGEA
jgi:CP family cyanate transporter-like MFS transporter